MPDKAILYAAKSTEDKRGSIPTQLDDARAMAEREGWKVVGEYSDEAASAWSGDRGPKLAAAMEHAEREAPSMLVVQHTDRLARGDGVTARHLGEIHFWAAKAEIQIRSVQDDDTFTNPLLAFVMGERNAEDSRRKSRAVKDGMRRRREAGKHHGGPRPYGYEYADGALVAKKAEAEIVCRIFSECIAGRSQLAITRGLIADKVPTIRGGKWHQGTVRTILANPIYAGRIGEATGQHEAIVESQIWKKAEALREARARTYGRGRAPAGGHLFRKGMLRCGVCGEAMVPRTDRNRREGPYEVYRCYGRHRDPDTCSMPPISRTVIDNAVYAYYTQLGLDVDATRQQLANARDRKLTEIRVLREDADRQLTKAQEGRERIERDYVAGELSSRNYERLVARLDEGEIPGAVAEVERLREREAEVEQDGSIVDAEQELLERLGEIRRAIAGEVSDAASTEAVRAALSRLFDRFIIHPAENPRYGRQRRDDPEPWPDRPPMAPLVEVENYIIEVWIKEQVVVSYDNGRLVPILRREPLDQGADNDGVGLTT
jgi:site-specific DNA recombinase